MIHTSIGECFPSTHCYAGLSELKTALKDGLHQDVVKSTKLFWLAFCKIFAKKYGTLALAPSQVDGRSIKYTVKLDREKDRVLCTPPRGHMTHERIQYAVEDLRCLFKKSIEENRPITIAPIPFGSFCYLQDVHAIDMAEWRSEGLLRRCWNVEFESLIEPIILQLANKLGLNCTPGTELQPVTFDAKYYERTESDLSRLYTVEPKPPT